MISVHFQGKPFNITVIQVYAPTTNAKEANVEWVYEDLQDLLELISKKRCPFHHRGTECKIRTSRDTQDNRQVWHWRTTWWRTKASRDLSREQDGHRRYPFPTAQQITLTMDMNRWSIPRSYWLYYLQPKMEKLYTVTKMIWSWLWLRSSASYFKIQT